MDAYRQQSALTGTRTKDDFVTGQDVEFLFRAVTTWHTHELKDQAGITMTAKVDGYTYELFLSCGMLRSFLDMQASAQKETDRRIREARAINGLFE